MHKLLQSLSALGVSATLVTPNLNAEATDNSVPELKGVEDAIIQKGESYNLLSGVSAYDKEDGDLTDQIKVNGNVNTNKIGKYKVEYQVIDSDGAKEISERYIEVKWFEIQFNNNVFIFKSGATAFNPLIDKRSQLQHLF